MTILTIRSDKPQAEIGLFDDGQELTYEKWQAHRQLAETIHTKIETLLKGQAKDWHDIQGIVGYKGPGSFTGLRIGLTVGNTLAYGLGVPIVGATGNKWQQQGIKELLNGKDQIQTLPVYGSEAHITLPKK